ncbi:MAG: tRNA (adenosine(37)-N6)-threonylcarbamoyltransferase complex ATPase subunit type 1 TsaE, partial [Pseudomonadota bacterium]|nr:tRNA (adenosine(37)-N6)-threonylcarbamoyltransferase complex ATPase subunit type 1 TsaE [Pseudomonadota bacterium]
MSQTVEQILVNEAATEAFGQSLLDRIRAQIGPSALVTLQGDLGAGKTTLVRGILRGLGFTGAVKSPTYTLLEPYSIDGFDLYHFDLYRLETAEELEFVGFEEILDGSGIKLFEWPQKGEGWLPNADVSV